MARVLITGAKGTVGKQLTQILRDQEHEVLCLTRDKISANEFEWDWESGYIDEKALVNIDHVIHLAGETIGKRWTKKRKERIYNSRIRSIQLLYDGFKALGHFPKTFVCASAVGYYGMKRTDHEFTELDNCGEDFLANVCFNLENAADSFTRSGVRVVKIRTGIVISNEKTGFLHELKQTLKFRFLVVAGTGEQYVPWIHLHDLCSVYSKAIDDKTLQGAVNAVAAEHITNKQIVTIIKKRFPKWCLILKIPGFIIELMFGEMAQLLLTGNKVSNKRALNLGISFKFDSFNKCVDE